jgi:glycine C-acetyltransferase
MMHTVKACLAAVDEALWTILAARQGDVEVGTLSKAFGVVGGLVAGNSQIIEWLRQRSRPFCFLPQPRLADVAACIAAVDLLENSTELVDRLWENANYFKPRCEIWIQYRAERHPNYTVMLGEAPLAQQFSRELFEEGVFAMSLGFPTVPQGKARIRVMISAVHSHDDLDQGLAAFKKVGQKLKVI